MGVQCQEKERSRGKEEREREREREKGREGERENGGGRAGTKEVLKYRSIERKIIFHIFSWFESRLQGEEMPFSTCKER